MPEKIPARSIDRNELFAFLRARLGIVAAILLACETLIVAASLLVTPEFRSESMVRMAKIADNAGAQGMIVEKVREKLSARPVILTPRTALNTVLITATGGTPEEAVALAEQATEMLIEEGHKVAEDLLQIPAAQQAMLEQEIVQLDAEIRELRSIEPKGNDLLLYVRLRSLVEERSKLRIDLIRLKLKTQQDFSPPVRIAGPHLRAQQSRPRWGRNLLLGGVFGACFGAFVVLLLGVFRQLAVQQSR